MTAQLFFNGAQKSPGPRPGQHNYLVFLIPAVLLVHATTNTVTDTAA